MFFSQLGLVVEVIGCALEIVEGCLLAGDEGSAAGGFITKDDQGAGHQESPYRGKSPDVGLLPVLLAVSWIRVGTECPPYGKR